jgi:hypothetical protein
MNQIWEELGPKFKDLLELGKTGVIDSILVACQRLETNRLEVSLSLTYKSLRCYLKYNFGQIITIPLFSPSGFSSSCCST